MANTPVYSRLKLHRDWAYDAPLKFLWALYIYPRNGRTLTELGTSIKTVIDEYESNKSGSWPVKTDLLEYINDPGGRFGIALAQNVAFPLDAFNMQNTTAGDGSGGYIGLPYSGNRSSYGGENKLDITFFETNIDIFDYFIRPWVIANSYKGLIELGSDDVSDLKCNMQVALFTRDYTSYNNNFPQVQRNLEVRKVFEFDDVVPFQMRGDTLNYSDLTYNDLSRTVSFAFSRYRVMDNSAIPINIF